MLAIFTEFVREHVTFELQEERREVPNLIVRQHISRKAKNRTLIISLIRSGQEWATVSKLIHKSDVHTTLPQNRGSPRNEIARAPELDTVSYPWPKNRYNRKNLNAKIIPQMSRSTRV